MTDLAFDWPPTVGEGTFLDFRGWLDESLMGEIGLAMRAEMEAVGVNPYKPRDIFSVFVELAQNIVRYSPLRHSENPEARYGAVRVGRENGSIFVAAQNPISAEAVEPMRRRLADLNDRTEDELKTMYRMRLRGEPEPGSKGASVGFIQVARQASKPFEFEFGEEKNGLCVFTLKVTM